MEKSLVTVGIPVYNGELFIKKCIESVLSQTYENFELLISDNSSTDSTQEICKKYSNADNRIHFFRQKTNLGVVNNIKFLLEKARGEFFVFLSVDNYFGPDFLRRNILLLEKNPNAVGATSETSIDKKYADPFVKEKKILKKMRMAFRPLKTHSIVGNYEKRIQIFLQTLQWWLYSSIFRIDEFRKSQLNELFVGSDGGCVLNLLKFGNILVNDEVELFSYPHGEISKGMLVAALRNNPNLIGRIIPFYPLTRWCFANLGWKLCFKNIHHLIRLNLDGLFLQLLSIYQIRKKNLQKENQKKLEKSLKK